MQEFGIQWDFTRYNRSSDKKQVKYRIATVYDIKIFKHCPVLSLLNNKNDKLYYKSIRSIVESISGKKFPDPEIEKSSFLSKLKANKKILIPETPEKMMEHINMIPNTFDVYQYMYNFQESLQNPQLFFETTKLVINSEKIVHNIELYEQLFIHFSPFLLQFKINPDYHLFEQQCIIMSLFEAIVLSYPIELKQYAAFVERVINCFINLIIHSRESIQMCAWRYLTFIVKVAVFRVSEPVAVNLVENIVTKIIHIPQIHQMLYHLLVTMKDVIFLPVIYFSSQILKRVEFDQRDLQNIMNICRKNTRIRRPFPIMRYMLQHSIYPSEKTSICFLILSENKRYFKTCKFLVRWSRVYIKRTFQWLVIAKKANRYYHFRRYVAYNLWKLYNLNIPNISESIEVAASSLLFYYPNFPDVAGYFQISRVEPEFQEDFKYLFYNMHNLKFQLLYPAGCFKPREEVDNKPKQTPEGSDDENNDDYDQNNNSQYKVDGNLDSDELNEDNELIENFVQFEFPSVEFSYVKSNILIKKRNHIRKRPATYMPFLILVIAMFFYFVSFAYFQYANK